MPWLIISPRASTGMVLIRLRWFKMVTNLVGISCATSLHISVSTLHVTRDGVYYILTTFFDANCVPYRSGHWSAAIVLPSFVITWWQNQVAKRAHLRDSIHNNMHTMGINRHIICIPDTKYLMPKPVYVCFHITIYKQHGCLRWCLPLTVQNCTVWPNSQKTIWNCNLVQFSWFFIPEKEVGYPYSADLVPI